jgi:hypothetical protein
MIRFGTSRVIPGGIGCSLIAGLASAQKLEVEARDTAPDAVTDPRLSLDVLGPHISGAIDRELAARGLARGEGKQG